jgi:hypothetical protein
MGLRALAGVFVIISSAKALIRWEFKKNAIPQFERSPE